MILDIMCVSNEIIGINKKNIINEINLINIPSYYFEIIQYNYNSSYIDSSYMDCDIIKKLKGSKIWDQEFKDINDVFDNAIMKSDLIPDFSKAITNIVLTSDILKNNLDKFLKQNDLSLAQKNVLESLYFCNKEYLTQRELSKFVYTSKSNISSLLNRMEEKGLIERGENKNNRREKQVKITNKGLKCFYNIYDESQKHMAFFEEIINKKDAQVLNEVLNKIRKYDFLGDKNKKND